MQLHRTTRNCLAATVAAAAILAAGPVAAQDSAARLEALQEQIKKLEREIAAMKGDVAKTRQEARRAVEKVAAVKAPPPPGPSVRMSSGNRPSICSADGRNCIALTSRLHLDYAAYDFNPNTGSTSPQNLFGGLIARRAQLGVIGTFLDDWEYSLVLEAGGSAGGAFFTSFPTTTIVLDTAYLAYKGFKPFTITGGYFTVPYTLEEMTSSNNITFMERAAPQSIAVGIGGGTRSGLAVTANDKQWWAGVALTGPAFGPHALQGPNTSMGGHPQAAVVGRAAFVPVLTDNASLLIGGSALYLFEPPASKQLRLRERIEMRVDGSRVLDTGNISNVSSARVLSAELAGTLGSFHFQGEYFDFNVERAGGAADLDFQGYYVQAGYILTGEKRSYSAGSGSYGSVTPSRPFDGKGNWGAWEIAARYSDIDLDDKDIRGGRQKNITVGVNWYVNRNIRFMFNYINGKVERRTGGGVDVGAKYQAFGGRAQVAF